MYVDLNGNGVHDSGDVLAPSGTQAVSVWLDTAHNRDGSPAACVSGPEVTSLDGFEVILHATGGTVAYSSPSNGFQATPVMLQGQDGTDYHAGRISVGTTSSPNVFLLGTIQVTPASGSPQLTIAASTPLSPRFATAFGSTCYGLDYDNWLKFGQDWLDSDGTASSSTVTISGVVFDDANSTSSSGCTPDAGEGGVIGQLVTLDPGSLQVTTGPGGIYRFYDVPDGNYTVSLTPGGGLIQTCPPANASHGVTIASGVPVGDLNFGIRGFPSPDIATYLVGRSRVKPGFFHILYLQAVNEGGGWANNVTVNVTLPPELSFQSSSSGSLTFPIGSIAPLNTVPEWIKVGVSSGAVLGTYVTSTATVDPVANDPNPINDTGTSTSLVAASIDPNEKEVVPAGRILRPQLLTYQVGFQNTGSAPATTVVVKDLLDAGLDLSTLKVRGASHRYKLSIAGRELTWTFPHIELPEAAADEAASHGTFKYSIMPLSSIPDGTRLTNAASIYFDFNPPIVTNAVTDTIDSAPTLAPIPNRTVVEGSTVDQALQGTDPEGDWLSFTKTSGPSFASVTTTGLGMGNLHFAPTGGDVGTYAVGITATDGVLSHSRTANVNVLALTGVEYAGSLPPQDINLASAAPQISLRLEGGTLTFSPGQVVPGSLKLSHTRGGKIETAAEAGSGPGEVGQRTFRFATSDIRRLFTSVEDGAQVTATCEGKLESGAAFEAAVPVRIHAPRGLLSAGLSPNPIREGGLLTFRTKKSGHVKVALYSVSGRLVRKVYEQSQAPAGYYAIAVPPRDDDGKRLGTGIYFYRIETDEGRESGRLTVIQ